MNGDCPPKADAGLKPGEFKVNVKEVKLPTVLHSACPVPDICGKACVVTANAQRTRQFVDKEVLLLLCGM